MKKLLIAFLSLLSLSLVHSGYSQNLKISELLFHASDVDDSGHEYIEIVGTPGASISSGTYFISMLGDLGSSLGPGRIFSWIDLSGMTLGSNGYLLLLQEGHSYSVDPLATTVTGVGSQWGNLSQGAGAGLNYPNGSYSYFLINTTDVLSSATDYDDGSGTQLRSVLNANAASWTILDGIGYMDGGLNDAGYAPINFTPVPWGGFPNPVVTTGVNNTGYFARDGATTGSTASDWVVAEIKGVAPVSFVIDYTTGSFPLSYVGNPLDDIGSLNTFSTLSNFPPTITTFGEEIAAIYADKERGLTYSDMIGAGDEADADGSVVAFVIQSVSSGTLRLGANSTTATPFSAGTNDQIDPSNFAYWTPDVGAEGDGIVAFDVKVEDNEGLLSSNAVDVMLDVMGDIRLSEVLFYMPDDPDLFDEYVELKGTPNTKIPPNTFLVCVSGENPGVVPLNFDLEGYSFGSNGYLVLLQGNNSYSVNASANTETGTSTGRWSLGGDDLLFENDSYSFLLALTNHTIILGTDYDSDNDGTLEGISNFTIVDGISNLDGDAADVAYGPLAFSPNGTGISQSTIYNTGGFIPSYFARRHGADGSGAEDWSAAIVEGKAASTFQLKAGSTYPNVFSTTLLSHIGTDNLAFDSWLGLTSNWNESTNWSSGSIPGIDSYVFISNQNGSLNVTGEAIARSLEMENGVEVTIQSGSQLSVLDTIFGSGQVYVLRNKSGDGNYSIIGSPVKNATISDLSADYIYDYDGTDFTVPNGAMSPGKGYFVSYNNTSPTVDLLGVPNSGTITVPVSTAGDGFNLVANPYTAAIERVEFILDNPLLDGNIWIWDDGGENSGADRGGDYILVNNLGSVSTVALRDGVSGEKAHSVDIWE